MDHPTRDSGLGLEPEGERQQQLHQTEVVEEELKEEEEALNTEQQPKEEEKALSTEQQNDQNVENVASGESVRLVTAPRDEDTVVREQPKLERAQSSIARRERELPRVPPSDAGSITYSQAQQSNTQDPQPRPPLLTYQPPSDGPPDRHGTPLLSAMPAFSNQIPSIASSSQNPRMPESSYNPYQQGYSDLAYNIAAAALSTGSQHLLPEVQQLQSQVQSEVGHLQAGVQSQIQRTPSLRFVRDLTAAAVGGAVGANVAQDQLATQPQTQASHGFFSDLSASLRPVLIGAAAEAGANVASRMTAAGGHLQGQVQQPLQNNSDQHPAGTGFFRDLASNMFSHGNSAQPGLQAGTGNVQQSGPAVMHDLTTAASGAFGAGAGGTAGNAGVGAGAGREHRQDTKSSTRPLSSNASMTHSPVSLTDERAQVHLAPQVRDFSSMPGQYPVQQQRQHQSSLPPQNGQNVNYGGVPRSDGGGGAGGGGGRGGDDDRLSRHRSHRSHLDWIVPVNGSANGRADEKIEQRAGPQSVAGRLKSTRDNAILEEKKYSIKAVRTGYTLNAAIGVQVLLNALITGLAAAGSGRLAVSLLGGAGTVVASYLARARGTNEPETSQIRARDLQKFLRDIDAFIEDYGYSEGHEYDNQISAFRDRFEKLLGNTTDEDDKLKAQKSNSDASGKV